MFNRILTLTVKNPVTSVRLISKVTKEKWDLYAGVLVERLPVITKTLEPIEKQYQAHLSQLEFEQSLKSDFEVRTEKEKKQAQLLKDGDIDVDFDAVAKQTAQDMKDAYMEEFNKFHLAPRQTLADQKNDKTSINRKLEENLLLLVEQKLGNSKFLLLPQGKRNEGETMRQTAERVLKETCGNNLDVLFYGNSPCGFYKYKYPVNERNETVGAKIFFYRTALKHCNLDSKKLKFEWLDKMEFEKKVKKTYYTSVSQFLF